MVDIDNLGFGDKVKIETKSKNFDNLRVIGKIGNRNSNFIGKLIEEENYDESVKKEEIIYDTVLDGLKSYSLKSIDNDYYIEVDSDNYKIKNIIVK